MTENDFWQRNVVKRGMCYQNVCPSVELVSHAWTVQDIEILFTLIFSVC